MADDLRGHFIIDRSLDTYLNQGFGVAAEDWAYPPRAPGCSCECHVTPYWNEAPSERCCGPTSRDAKLDATPDPHHAVEVRCVNGSDHLFVNGRSLMIFARTEDAEAMRQALEDAYT